MFTHKKINLESVPISFGDRKYPDAESLVGEPKFTIGNDLVLYDQNRNCKLEIFELRQYYGDAFTTKDFNELRRIVRFGDAASYLDFKNRMAQKRDDKIVRLIRQQIKANKQVIQNHHGIDLDQLLSDSHLNAEDKTLALQDSFTPVYQDYLFEHDYPNKPDPAALKSLINLHLWIEFNTESHSDLNSLILAVNQSIQNDFDLNRLVENDKIYPNQGSEYAEIRYNETQQSDLLDQLEKKYKLDVQLVGHPLTESEVADLGTALEKIKQRRPGDLKLLKTLVLIQGQFRGFGYAGHPHQIEIRGPFGIRYDRSHIGPGENYASESDESFIHDNTVEYLFQKLTHELGHLVNDRDRSGKDNDLDPPTEYPRSERKEGKTAEWFAEDYSLFLLSDGKKVMKQTISGLEVGQYDETLDYFKRKYPLALR